MIAVRVLHRGRLSLTEDERYVSLHHEIKSNQIKSNQIKSNQIKSNQNYGQSTIFLGAKSVCGLSCIPTSQFEFYEDMNDDDEDDDECYDILSQCSLVYVKSRKCELPGPLLFFWLTSRRRRAPIQCTSGGGEDTR